jgi:hypothetical protein
MSDSSKAFATAASYEIKRFRAVFYHPSYHMHHVYWDWGGMLKKRGR